MGVGNPYLREEAAKNFEDATRIPREEFLKIGDFIRSACGVERDSTYGILDVGTGTGRTILGILQSLYEDDVDFRAFLFDISPAMHEEFLGNLRKFPALRRKVEYVIHDANEGLPPAFSCSEVDIATIVSVLQYLDDWRAFLSEVRRCLEPSGYLVQAELIGWYSLLDGTLDRSPPAEPIARKFWETYFSERKKYDTWDPEIQFSNMSTVETYCEERLGMKPVAQKQFMWTERFSWKDVLTWIEVGPVSSLGSNILEDESRNKLRKEMESFLRDNDEKINQNMNIRWGFRVFIHK